MTEASYALVARQECRGGASVAAIGADHERDHARSAAAHRAAGRVHGRRPRSARRAAGGARGLLHEFLGGMTEATVRAAWATSAATRRRHGNGAVHGSVPHMLVMFFAEPGGLGAFVQSATAVPGTRRSTAACAGDRGSRRRRAVRLRRRHQPAGVDWSQERDVSASRHRLQQRRGARRVPPRLSKRVQEVHRSAVARCGCRERGTASRRRTRRTRRTSGGTARTS